MWQGSFDSGISPRGERQLVALADRLTGSDGTRVVASDLSRTMATARAFTADVEPDAAWREFHVGAWEGLTTEEILVRFPGEMEAFVAGEDIAPGGGEPMSDFADRVIGAYGRLVGSMADGERAYVVTHGGVIWAAVSHVLGRIGVGTALIPSHNTALTTVVVDEGDSTLAVFNDATHLDHLDPQFGPRGSRVTLIRHGQSEGNVARRWQGHTDSPLTEDGKRQAAAASRYTPAVDEIYTSPLRRTTETATIIGEKIGAVSIPHPDLIEMSFGSWENLTTEEAAAADPAVFAKIYDEGIDVPRGGDGGTFAETGDRIARAVVGIAGDDEVAAVSHGAAIRAFAVHVLDMPFVERNRLPVPRNTAMSSVIVGEHNRLVLASYNVAPHLEV